MVWRLAKAPDPEPAEKRAERMIETRKEKFGKLEGKRPCSATELQHFIVFIQSEQIKK